MFDSPQEIMNQISGFGLIVAPAMGLVILVILVLSFVDGLHTRESEYRRQNKDGS